MGNVKVQTDGPELGKTREIMLLVGEERKLVVGLCSAVLRDLLECSGASEFGKSRGEYAKPIIAHISGVKESLVCEEELVRKRERVRQRWCGPDARGELGIGEQRSVEIKKE
jgi:hypothetical protein